MEGSWRGGKSEDAGGISILQRSKQAQGERESDLLHLTSLMGGVWGHGGLWTTSPVLFLPRPHQCVSALC